MKILLLALAICTTACGYDDETLEAEHYIQRVCAGAWPDYKYIQPDCEERRWIDKSKLEY